MSRATNTLLGNSNAYAQGAQNTMIDLSQGGQMGYVSDLSQLLSSQLHIRSNIIAVVIEGPKGFSYLPNSSYYYAALRELVERQAISIDGLAQGLEVQTVETPVGAAGEMMEHPVKTTRARSQVTMRWPERYGRPVFRFLSSYIRNLIMDPDTNFAAIGTLSSKPTDMLMDMFGCTIAFFEPDPTHSKVVQAWLGTGMWPKMTGDAVGRREITAASEETTYDVQWAGVYQVGVGVDQFCQKLLDAMNIVNANPNNRAAFIDAISSDITAASSSGYSAGIDTMRNKAVSV